jgi:hypothetical protein
MKRFFAGLSADKKPQKRENIFGKKEFFSYLYSIGTTNKLFFRYSFFDE